MERDGSIEYYCDGSYFLSDFLSSTTVLRCHSGYHNETLVTGEALLPSGSSCNDSTSPIQCTHDNNTFAMKRVGSFSLSDELAYKCCLPYSCDSHGTGMVRANIFGK